MKQFRAYADHSRYYFVEVRVFKTRFEMVKNIKWCGFDDPAPAFSEDSTYDDVQGQCSGLTHYSKSGRVTGKFACIWLNEDDLSVRPSEIPLHESVHAAMRYARNKNADLDEMAGEEVLAHAAGFIARNVIAGLYRHKCYR